MRSGRRRRSKEEQNEAGKRCTCAGVELNMFSFLDP